MKKFSTVTGLLVLISVLCGFQFHYTDQAPDSKENSQKRKFYEYPGDYGQEVQKLMDKFQADFGYELVVFGQAWPAHFLPVAGSESALPVGGDHGRFRSGTHG